MTRFLITLVVWIKTQGFWLWLAVIALVLTMLLSGCTRETAKSTIMASQAVEGGEKILASPELAAAVNDPRIPDDVRAVIRAKVSDACTLFAQARDNLTPAINLLSGGQPIDTGTSADDAAKDPAAFVRAASKQAGRADAEASDLLWWRSAGAKALSFAVSAASGTATPELLGGGLLTLLGGGGLLVARALQIKRKVSDAMAAYASDVAAVSPDKPEEIEAVKTAHAQRQRAAGIHRHVLMAVANAKATGAV